MIKNSKKYMINKLAWTCPAIIVGKSFRFLITVKDSPQLAIVAYKQSFAYKLCVIKVGGIVLIS